MYRDCDFLDAAMRCRLARFLHLALERNLRFQKGDPDGGPKRDFADVYADCSYCHSVSPAKNRLRRFLEEFGRILRHGQ